MPVRVDQAGHGDEVAAVDDLGVAGGHRRADVGDVVALDEDVAGLQAPVVPVEGEQARAADQVAGHQASVDARAGTSVCSSGSAARTCVSGSPSSRRTMFAPCASEVDL